MEDLNSKISTNEITLSDKVDKYNKLRLLYNILTTYITNAQYGETEIDDETKRVISVFTSNLSNFVISQKTSEEDFGVFYTDMKKVNAQFSQSTINNQDNMRLLSLFEEEIRNFLKDNKGIFDKIPTSINTEVNQMNVTSSKVKQITSLLNEDIKLFSELFSKFETNSKETKQSHLDEINTRYSEINKILQSISMYITTFLSSEQNKKSLEKIKDNLLEERAEMKNEIEVLKAEINKYVAEGEEMAKCVAEYKRLCNMIDCLK